MPDEGVVVGERWRHKNGLTVRIIGQKVPGDRDDELRVWCEVVIAGGSGYRVGERNGWHLLSLYGWQKIDKHSQ